MESRPLHETVIGNKVLACLWLCACARPPAREAWISIWVCSEKVLFTLDSYRSSTDTVDACDPHHRGKTGRIRLKRKHKIRSSCSNKLNASTSSCKGAKGSTNNAASTVQSVSLRSLTLWCGWSCPRCWIRGTLSATNCCNFWSASADNVWVFGVP